MKSIILLLTLCISLTSFAAKRGAPFQPHDDARFDSIESLADGNGLELSSGDIIVGDASGNANGVTMSGDATMSNAGALTVAAGAVEESMIVVQTADGKNLKRVIRANLDCGVSSCVVGTVSMVETLPANAIITQAYFFTEVQFVDGGAGTVALHCEDAGNIFAAADITGIAVDAVTSGVPIGTAGTMAAGIAAGCTITATIATAEQTAGVLTLFVEYVVHD